MQAPALSAGQTLLFVGESNEGSTQLLFQEDGCGGGVWEGNEVSLRHPRAPGEGNCRARSLLLPRTQKQPKIRKD